MPDWRAVPLLAVVLVPQAPSQVPTFSSEVQLITVDAVVLDKDGQPVPGLTRDDFVVSEDGRPVEIASFEAFVQGASPAAKAVSAPSAIATNTPRERESGRAFAVLIDDLGIAPQRSEDARRAVQSFLERGVRDGDEIVVGTTSGDAWWSARIPAGRQDLLAVAARCRGKYEETFSFNRMTEYEAFRIANYEDSPAMAAGSPGGLSGGAGGGRATVGAEPLPPGMGGARERVRKRWENAGLCMGDACDPMLRGRAEQMSSARRSRTRATLDAVSRGLEALRPIHGRKSLLLLSEGFLSDPGDRRQRTVVALSREANTAVYFLDVRGLTALPGSGLGSAADVGPGPGVVMETVLADRGAMSFEQSVLESTGSEGLASDTGGFSIRNTNDLGAGAARIADESRVFYLLGFNASEGKSETAWRKLQVSTTRPGLTVRARKGYTLSTAATPAKPPKKGAPRGPDVAVIRAIDSPHDASGVPIRARVYLLEPGQQQTRVLVMAEFDASGLLGPAAKRKRLEMSAVVRMRDEPQEFRYDQLVELKREEPAGTAWRSVVREFGLPAGVAMARLVLRDPESRAIGSVSSRFEVPQPDLLRLSTPILTNRVEPAWEKGALPQAALAVDRTFAKDAGLYCQFEVIAAKPGPDGKPHVTSGLAVWTDDGRLVRESPPSPIAPNAEGRAVRLVGIDLAGLPEGHYDLVLEAQDEVGGGRLRQREPFTIAASSAAATGSPAAQ